MSDLPATPGTAVDPDRLYSLLPAVHRSRDEQAGHPLRELLRVIQEQVDVVEDDVRGLYDNWFVETAEDWVVPYLGDLVGYRPVAEAGDPASASPALARALVPRREVANVVRSQRRKGTLALLEELGLDVAGWPGLAAEFARLLAVHAHLNFPHPDRGRAVDLHDVGALELLDGPFDRLAHTADLRRLSSRRAPGRHNIDAVGLWVWRTRSYPLVSSPAACVEEISPSVFTFSILGNDAPILQRPVPEDEDGPGVAAETNLPVPLRRRVLAADKEAAYGPGRSFAIEVGTRRGSRVVRQPVPVEDLVVADLGDWEYRPTKGKVAVDPERGRLAFPPGKKPVGVWVDYRYGASADIGGGPYPRRLPGAASGTFHQTVSRTRPWPSSSVRTIARALARWEKVRDKKPTCLIEVLDNEVYSESLTVAVRRGESVVIRAADRARPVIHLLDRRRNAPDAMAIVTGGHDNHDDNHDDKPDDKTEAKQDDKTDAKGKDEHEPGGCVRLDGLLITGRAVHVEGPIQRLEIVDCTLVPGWGLRGECEPTRATEPSLELYSCTGPVIIERSILGSIQVYADEVTTDPVEIAIRDSILDATGDALEALGAPNWPLAHASVSFSDCTVIGKVLTHAVELAENTIFTGQMRVARSQVGCLRHSYVPPGSRTPRRHRCQPDLAVSEARSAPGWDALTPAERETALTRARRRVVPVFDSDRYGTSAYVRLASACPPEIVRGADDESEMGVFHDLYQPQRLANLVARLEQYTPARTDSAVLVAD